MMRNLTNLNFTHPLCLCIFVLLLPNFSNSKDTISPSQSMKPGESLVSSKQHFEFGFFNPGSSSSNNHYLGIWYKQIPTPTIVWIANRDTPLLNSSGVLKITTQGNLNLVLVNQSDSIIWSSNMSKIDSKKPVLQLLDTGNLVLREEDNYNPEDYLWQSFDDPSDTLLPGMKLGWDLKKNQERFLTSWKRKDDPSTGDYSFRIDSDGFPETCIYRGAILMYRSGPWNGVQFSGVPTLSQTYIFNFSFISNEDEIWYSFTLKNDSLYSRLVMNESGQLQRYTWLDSSQSWNMFWHVPSDECDDYMKCGSYGLCNINNVPICKCLKGYVPKDQQDWYLSDGSGGCVKEIGFQCKEEDGFLTMKNVKLPDSSRAFVDSKMTRKECEVECRRNCSCKAFADHDITNGGSGCVIWVDDLKDLREYGEGGQDLFFRVEASQLENGERNDSKTNSKKKRRITLVATLTVVATTLLLLGLYILWKKLAKIVPNREEEEEEEVQREKSQELPLYGGVKSSARDHTCENKEDLELLQFDFDTIANATHYFSNLNKLGEGGFGCVYKGTLDDGQEIAVKRLSKNSGQGVEEFKNEVVLIAKLQHRNLVRLLGCCIEGEEKMLIYEYMQNKSLDYILFDKANKLLTDWQKRFNIIVGISRGLLYLHEDSRLRIVHRDLKASNVLLDTELNPKISDFGMARIFGGDETEGNTKRVVGTYGYMSPEYAMDGHFSVKSDVFSFGVLVLEIVSGKKNKGLCYSSEELNLLGHAWRLWNEGRSSELIDQTMDVSCLGEEILTCIQVGLLCVQERVEDRPTMSLVVLMINSDITSLPEPKQPGFLMLTSFHSGKELSSRNQESSSLTANHVTITMLEAR